MPGKTHKTSLSAAEVGSVHRLLAQKLDDKRGRRTEVEQDLGLPAGYFAYHSNRGQLEFGVLLDALKLMGLKASSFLAEALEGEAEGLAEVVGSNPPEPVTKVVESTSIDPDEDDTEAGQVSPARDGNSPKGKSPKPTVCLEWLGALDDLRYENPCVALQRLLEPEWIPPRFAAAYLGVCGSTLRMLVQLEDARRCLRVAEYLASRDGDSTMEARLLQRQAAVLAVAGHFEVALEMAERATGIYDCLGDTLGLSKAIHDQGHYLFHLAEYKRAIIAHRRALRYLDDPVYRIAALHALGFCYYEVGDLSSAMRYLDRAQGRLEAAPSSFLGNILWLKGTIQVDLGRFREAEKSLVAAVAVLKRVDPVDAALLALQVVRVQLLQGEGTRAWSTALEASEFIQPFKANRLMGAALVQLLRGGNRALTLEAVDCARRQIEESRAESGPRFSPTSLANHSADSKGRR